MSETLTLKLTLIVRYDLNGEDRDHLKSLLYNIPQHASGDGMMSGDGPAEVDDWSMKVEEVN